MDPHATGSRVFILYSLIVFCATLVAFTGYPSVGFTVIVVHIVWRIKQTFDPPRSQ